MKHEHCVPTDRVTGVCTECKHYVHSGAHIDTDTKRIHHAACCPAEVATTKQQKAGIDRSEWLIRDRVTVSDGK